jgi:tartrate/fumarate subfamily iron-sulfur-dependent hydro-lyase alpha chain
MVELRVGSDTLYEMMYGAITRAVVRVPQDIRQVLSRQEPAEQAPLARRQLREMLGAMERAHDAAGLACGDTGYPLFYVRVGDGVSIEGGLSTLQRVADRAVRDATNRGKLGAMLVHPLNGKSAGENVGPGLPAVDIRPAPGLDGLEITAVPMGGACEVYGTFFCVLQGEQSRKLVVKFALDSIVTAASDGLACPPNVIGIGLGGTSDICMRLAKEAAVLRPVGSRHGEAEIAQLEQEILEAANSLGVGPMGTGGQTTVLDVHIEYALTHSAGLPMAVNAQCTLARRSVAHLTRGRFMEHLDWPERIG